MAFADEHPDLAKQIDIAQTANRISKFADLLSRASLVPFTDGTPMPLPIPEQEGPNVIRTYLVSLEFQTQSDANAFVEALTGK